MGGETKVGILQADLAVLLSPSLQAQLLGEPGRAWPGWARHRLLLKHPGAEPETVAAWMTLGMHGQEVTMDSNGREALLMSHLRHSSALQGRWLQSQLVPPGQATGPTARPVECKWAALAGLSRQPLDRRLPQRLS